MLINQLFSIQPKVNTIAANWVRPNYFRMEVAFIMLAAELE
jgi:hypothetical protein